MNTVWTVLNLRNNAQLRVGTESNEEREKKLQLLKRSTARSVGQRQANNDVSDSSQSRCRRKTQQEGLRVCQHWVEKLDVLKQDKAKASAFTLLTILDVGASCSPRERPGANNCTWIQVKIHPCRILNRPPPLRIACTGHNNLVESNYLYSWVKGAGDGGSAVFLGLQQTPVRLLPCRHNTACYSTSPFSPGIILFL